jgi:hypothetical protein
MRKHKKAKVNIRRFGKKLQIISTTIMKIPEDTKARQKFKIQL